jgi:hypothetical protein
MIERSVDRFNTEVEKVLTNREDILSEVVQMLGNRAEDLDSMMRNYVTLIEESLTRAQGRSEEIARIIAAQTSAAAENLQNEIRKLEEVSDQQIAQAARTLREQHEKVTTSLAEMLAIAGSEFGATAREMRATAQQVVKDIDFARSELKRSILDLPEETRANADAMRRVVADQITALNALADVVKRQSGLASLSGPGIYLRPDDRGADPGKSEGATSTAPQPGTSGARQTQGKRGDGGNGEIRGRPLSALINTPAPEGSANLLPRLAEPNGQGGGMSDGKRAASALPKDIQRLVARLNAASRSLVEVIEGKLPAELEQRYGAGEDHVFAQHLYQQRGPRLQSSLARRYEGERMVRNRVDNFIQLFETLLDTVAKSARGDEMVDACLASESGKVYIALAQAAGRLTA